MASHIESLDFIALVPISADLPFPNFFCNPYQPEEFPLRGIPGVLVDCVGTKVLIPGLATSQIEAALAPVESPQERLSQRGGVIAERAQTYFHESGFLEKLAEEEGKSEVVFTSDEIGSIGDE